MTTGIGQLVAPSGNVYDPSTNTYRPVAVPSIGGVDAQPTAWDTMSNQAKSDFYAANPGFAAVTQGLQGLFSLTTPGMVQSMFNPGFVAEQASIARGGLSGLSGFAPSNQSLTGGLLAALLGTQAGAPVTDLNTSSLAAMMEQADPTNPSSFAAVNGMDAQSDAAAGADGVGPAYAQGGLVSTPFQGEVARMVASLPQFRSRL